MKYSFLVLFCSCFIFIKLSAQDYPRTIQISKTQKIKLTKKPKRIFVGYVGALEIIMKLVDKERIIAAPNFAVNNHYSNCVEYAKKIPLLYQSLNVEVVEKNNPDLLILASFNDPKFLALLKKFKRKYIVVDAFNSYADIKKTITLFGNILGEEQKAKQLIVKMEKDLQKIKLKNPKRKLKIMSYGHNRYSAGLNTIFNDMVESAGAINVTAANGITGHKAIGNEQLLKLNPDVIVFLSSSEETRNKFLKEYSSKPVFKSINAIKNKKIILLNPAYGTATSQFFVKGVENLHKKLYQ